MFALIEIAFLVALGWGVVQLVQRAQQRDQQRKLDDPGFRPPIGVGPPPERSSTMEVDGRRGDSIPASLTQQLSPKASREQRMLELKRQYVNDEISVETYELELDKLMREPGEARN
jgi:hypothetical protein